MSTPLSETGRIEQGLDATRSKLNTHLNELQGRLSPGQVLDDLMTYFRGREGAEFGRNLVENVRANPLPVAVSGIGLAWLMASSPRGGTTGQATASGGAGRVQVYRGSPDLGLDDHAAMTKRVREAEQNVVYEPGEADHAYAARLDAARGDAVGITREPDDTEATYRQRIRDALASAQQTVGRSGHDLRDQVGSTASSVGTSMQGAAHSIGDATQRAGSSVVQGGHAATQAAGSLAATLSGNPILLGTLGLAAGALLGALLPQSDQEEETIGAVASQARASVRGLAQQAADAGGHVAQTMIDKGRDSAQTHGLTSSQSPGELLDAAMSGDLAGDAKQVASEVLRAGDDAVRKNALAPAADATKPE